MSDETETLKHTYLRVFYPMLAHTQLQHVHYKQEELIKLFNQLSGKNRSRYYLPVSETTSRLVARCLQVPWLSGAALSLEGLDTASLPLLKPLSLSPDDNLSLKPSSTLSLPSCAAVTEKMTGSNRTVPVNTITTKLVDSERHNVMPGQISTNQNGNGIELVI